MAKLLSEVKAAASKYAKAIPALEGIEKIDVRLAALKDEAKRASGGWLPRAEVTARLLDWLKSLDGTFSGGNVAQAVSGVSFQQFGLRLAPGHPAEDALAFILWLLGPEQVEKLARAAVARDAYDEGLSTADRAKLKSALAGERERIVAEREELVETCRAAGVEVAHLKETAERRDAEARTAARAADVTTGLAARQAEIDRQDAIERRL